MSEYQPDLSGRRSEQHARTGNRRQFLKAAGLTGATVATAGCTIPGMGGDGGGFADRDEIRLGVITAEEQITGQSMIRSMEMAVEDINENGGIADKELTLHVGDSQMDPNQAVTAYQNLVNQQDIDMLAGIWISEVGMTLMENIADDELITNATAFGSPEATQQVREDYDRYKYFFRTQLHTYQMAEWSKDYITEFLVEELDVERVGLLIEDALWSGPYGDELETFIGENSDLELVFHERPATDVSEFGPILRDAADNDPDVLYTIFSHLPGTTFFDPWQQNQYNFLIDGFINTAMQFNYWGATQGQANYAGSKFQQGFSPEVPGMIRDYLDRQPEDDAPGPHWQSYDAVWVLADAMESAQTLDPDELVAELEDISYEGVGGVIEFHDQDADHPHNFIVDRDHVYPRHIQWREVDEENPITGGGVPYTIWPDYEEFALVDDADSLDTEGLPTVEPAEYQVPPWVDL